MVSDIEDETLVFSIAIVIKEIVSIGTFSAVTLLEVLNDHPIRNMNLRTIDLHVLITLFSPASVVLISLNKVEDQQRSMFQKHRFVFLIQSLKE